MNNATKRIALVITIGIGLQLLLLFLYLDPNALKWSDPNHYFSIASRIANGESFGAVDRDLYRSPGYPYFLSIIIWTLGPSILIIRLVHIFLFSVFIIGYRFDFQ